ncbi:adenosylcobalamin-dependent ribonucleoside-diphosphate reductase [Ferruginibacter lapsinanis]|uniref:adenosylcobalamin-dependent ribonucleoside-diphosphate reductase n=1 Tax=Ferruginibacter lapsinanis TaxID=563172 RepID=UPI001E64D677|nr:adenosylcobalamin-dependent ribonucleoside-diphosphate reductase [Ferruginibacter lapsinanis]UEG48862.1 adenosylcobalamin-dependent ribonucleoside-diphosphate reductase [Ferruginibacter lapsinanis]
MARFSENSLRLLQHLYLQKNAGAAGFETPHELFRRVAKSVAAAELVFGGMEDATNWEQVFYKVMSSLCFLPNSPTLMNAGIGSNQLSACFVLPVEDNMDSIFTTLKQAALIQQSGGGTGFNFSHLRPKGDIVSGIEGIAAGPVSFMKIFNTATEHIKQGGKRRGANMGILNIDHPDIEEFIFAKREKNELNNFNISVAVSDEFMHCLERNGNWDLIHPNLKGIVKTIEAKKIWNDIIESAWATGDPGLVFIDTINDSNPLPELGRIESTNPCGEVPLLAYEACNLGSINLTKFVHTTNEVYQVSWNELEKMIHIAIRFLDDVIAVNNYLMPEIKERTSANRKIGLGIMGWAEMLMMLEIPYESEQAVQLAENLMRFIQQKSFEASAILAERRGVFPNWEKSIYYPDKPLRNATRTCIASTGSISIIADTSSSIEPLFALAFSRQHIMNGEMLIAINNKFVNYLKKHHLYSEKIVEQVLKEGIVDNVKELPEIVKNIFKSALEISPFWHLRHQIVFQQYTDNAVSKTINLPENSTIEEVGVIYKDAWFQKAKGITIFRYNSKGKQVMYRGIRSVDKACKVCVE